MKTTFSMTKHEAALERLHRARCIVSTIAANLEKADTPESIEAAGALEAAAELIMQGMAAIEFRAKEPPSEEG